MNAGGSFPSKDISLIIGKRRGRVYCCYFLEIDKLVSIGLIRTCYAHELSILTINWLLMPQTDYSRCISSICSSWIRFTITLWDSALPGRHSSICGNRCQQMSVPRRSLSERRRWWQIKGWSFQNRAVREGHVGLVSKMVGCGVRIRGGSYDLDKRIYDVKYSTRNKRERAPWSHVSLCWIFRIGV